MRRARSAGSPDVEVLARAPQPDASARESLVDAEALLVLDLPPAILEACPKLRFVQAFSSGIEHLPAAALQARGLRWGGATDRAIRALDVLLPRLSALN